MRLNTLMAAAGLSLAACAPVPPESVETPIPRQ